MAKKVETDAMHKVALNYFSKQSHLKKTDLSISETIPFEYNNEICFTIYNFTQKGYIVVSNHDEIEPILGYGLQNNFDIKNAPPALLDLLSAYQKEISFIKKQKIKQHKDIKKKWDIYQSDAYSVSSKSYSIETNLIQTEWHQKAPYNDSIHVDPVTNNNCYVGCNAVALGQLLYYWNCKIVPDGFINSKFNNPTGLWIDDLELYNRHYPWDIMLDNNASQQTNYIAQLLNDCAISLNSLYVTTSSSGEYQTISDFSDLTSAIEHNFNLQHSGIHERNNYMQQPYVWDAMLISSISQEHPILYTGSGTGAHTFIVDGFNPQYEFHCNWGWGTSNDFFHLNNLTPLSHNYSSDQKAILEIRPYISACEGIPGANLICSTNSYTYSITIPPLCSVQWSVSNNLVITSGANNSTVTIGSNSHAQGNATITANIYNSHGVLAMSRSKEVWVGVPYKPTNIFFNPYEPCLNQVVFGQASNNNPVLAQAHYNWSGTHTYNDQNIDGSSVYFNTLSNSVYTAIVSVNSSNACGSSIPYSKSLSVIDCGGSGGLPVVTSIAASPNPASTEATISFLNANETYSTNNLKSTSVINGFTANQAPVPDFITDKFDVSIYNVSGFPVYKGKMVSGSLKVDVSTWKKGLYLAKVFYKNQKVECNFIVE